VQRTAKETGIDRVPARPFQTPIKFSTNWKAQRHFKQWKRSVGPLMNVAWKRFSQGIHPHARGFGWAITCHDEDLTSAAHGENGRCQAVNHMEWLPHKSKGWWSMVKPWCHRRSQGSSATGASSLWFTFKCWVENLLHPNERPPRKWRNLILAGKCCR